MKKRYHFTYIVEADGEEEDFEDFEAQLDIFMCSNSDYGKWRLDFVEEIKDDEEEE